MSGTGDWYRRIVQAWWERLRFAGVSIGSYQPKKVE